MRKTGIRATGGSRARATNTFSGIGRELRSVAALVDAIESIAPSSAAEPWDPVGLLTGQPENLSPGVLATVDLTHEVIDQAVAMGLTQIVAHHPAIFPKQRGLNRLQLTHPAVYALSKGVAVVTVHTNFDRCALEMIQTISKSWGVRPRGRLFEDLDSEPLTKLSVYVPKTHHLVVRDAILGSGAGSIGDYDSCSFSVEGVGTFRGSEGTNPFLGKPGKLEQASEVRLETVFPTGLKSQVLRALRSAHPYEEIAFDLFELRQGTVLKGITRGLGYGFWGDFATSRSPDEFSKSVGAVFGLTSWLHNRSAKPVRRVAFSMGKGSSFWKCALKAGCDAFVTGEMGYHDSLAAARQGLWVLELGHVQSEVFFSTTVSDWLTPRGFNVVCVNDPHQEFTCLKGCTPSASVVASGSKSQLTHSKNQSNKRRRKTK